MEYAFAMPANSGIAKSIQKELSTPDPSKEKSKAILGELNDANTRTTKDDPKRDRQDRS